MATHTATLQCYQDGNIRRCYALVEMEVTSLPAGTAPLVVQVSGSLTTREISFNRQRIPMLSGENLSENPTAGIGLDTQKQIIIPGNDDLPGWFGNMFWASGKGIAVGDTTEIAIMFPSTAPTTATFSSPHATFSPATPTLQLLSTGRHKYAIVDMTVTHVPPGEQDIIVTVTASLGTWQIPFNREVPRVFDLLTPSQGTIVVGTGLTRRQRPRFDANKRYLLFSAAGDGIAVGDTTQLAIYFSTPPFSTVTFSSPNASFSDIAFTLPADTPPPPPASGVNATLLPPDGTHTGNFSVSISMNQNITGFTKTDISLTAVSGNGVTGVDFTLTGSNNSYILTFTLPANASGSFSIAITGTVTRAGQSTPETVTGNIPTIRYDTRGAVQTRFGTVAYREGGVVAVPVTFGEIVIAPAKSIFAVKHVSGDALTDIEYRLIGKNTAFELIFEIPPDRSGSFKVTANGDVFKVASSTWDPVVITPAHKDIAYDTRVPVLENYDIPSNYTPGAVFDVILQYDLACTVNNPIDFFGDDDATYLDFFIFEGADLGTPNLYRKTDDTYPTLPIGTVSDTDKTPPVADWTQQHLQVTPATIYLLRWHAVNANATGVFDVTIKEGFVRGPTRDPQRPAQERNYLGDGSGNFLGDGKGNFIGTGNP